MGKQQILIEKELKCKSANIIWKIISTPEGLAKWIADDVADEGEWLRFTWGETWSNHEIRRARKLEEQRFDYIRFAWENDENDEYWELKIEKSELKGDFILIITDHALAEDVDALEDIWDSNLEQLHNNTGL